jgi:hypothetical protein
MAGWLAMRRLDTSHQEANILLLLDQSSDRLRRAEADPPQLLDKLDEHLASMHTHELGVLAQAFAAVLGVEGWIGEMLGETILGMHGFHLLDDRFRQGFDPTLARSHSWAWRSRLCSTPRWPRTLRHLRRSTTDAEPWRSTRTWPALGDTA